MGKAIFNHEETDEEYLDICERIVEWALEHPEFDDSFVLRMKEIIEDGTPLTDPQKDGLDNIISGFNIE